MFFLYANIFPTQFEHLFGLSRDMLFVEHVFEAVQLTRGSCLIGSKATRLRVVALYPDKRSLIKHYLNNWVPGVMTVSVATPFESDWLEIFMLS